MKRKKLSKRWKVGFKITAWIALIAVPVYAVTQTSWVHPCVDENDLTCIGQFGAPPCVCDGDFDNNAHWKLLAPNGNIAVIVHSNASVTDEDILRMAFTNETVYELRIFTDNTGGDDELDILFDDAATITVSKEVKLDATNGKLTFRVDSGGKIVTQ